MQRINLLDISDFNLSLSCLYMYVYVCLFIFLIWSVHFAISQSQYQGHKNKLRAYMVHSTQLR